MRVSRLRVALPLVFVLTACSGGAATRRIGPAPAEGADAAPPVAAALFLPLIEAHEGWDGPGRTFAYLDQASAWEAVETHPGLRPADEWDGCEPTFQELPAQIAEAAGIGPPSTPAWLVGAAGSCSATLGPPFLLLGQSNFLCDAVVALQVEPGADCGPLGAPLDPAPYIVVAERVRPDLRWVPVELVDPELAPQDAGVQLTWDGVTSEIAYEPMDWERDELERWRARVSAGDASLRRGALIERVSTPTEAVENRRASWFYLDGTNPDATIDCSCQDWETRERIPDCVDEYFELTQVQLGLVHDGALVVLPKRWEFIRGAFVEDDSIAALVTGYLGEVALHRRVGPTEFEWTDLVSPYFTHEEDSEQSPVEQAPYCGP